jgi:hypothetical protein
MAPCLMLRGRYLLATLLPRVATGGKTLEEHTDADFATFGIVPVTKVLVHDLLSDD